MANMMTINMVCLIGRLKVLKTLKKDDKDCLYLEIAVSDEKQNIFPIYLLFTKPEITQYLKIGDLVGIKGHLEIIEDSIKIIGEKISFLSSNKSSGEKNE